MECQYQEEAEIQHHCLDCDTNWSTERGKTLIYEILIKKSQPFLRENLSLKWIRLVYVNYIWNANGRLKKIKLPQKVNLFYLILYKKNSPLFLLRKRSVKDFPTFIILQVSSITVDNITLSSTASQRRSSTKSSAHFVRRSSAFPMNFINTQTVITKLKYPSTGSPATLASKTS